MSKSHPGKLIRRSIAFDNNVNSTYDFPDFMLKPKEKTFGEFIYDSKTGKFLTRTPKSWCELIVFYSIFYLCLAALFAVCLKGLLATLDFHSPKWKLDESLIGTNPGLGFRPIADDVDQGSLIWYDSSNDTQIAYWTDIVDNFLQGYNQTKGKQKVCDFDSRPAGNQVCKLDITQFGECTKENHYGYKNSAPCIFLKLNRIYGWEPEYFNDPAQLPSDMPISLKHHIGNITDPKERNQVWVSCQGEEGNDKELLGDIEYFPTRGFPSYFYPYTNKYGYVSPLVAVKFVRPKVNQILNIECRAWAKNIVYSGSHRDRKGSVHFELMIDADS